MILYSVEEYDKKLRIWTIRNVHKMNKINDFLEKFEKLGLGDIEEEADNLKCLAENIVKMNFEWCQNQNSTKYNCTGNEENIEVHDDLCTPGNGY